MAPSTSKALEVSKFWSAWPVSHDREDNSSLAARSSPFPFRNLVLHRMWVRGLEVVAEVAKTFGDFQLRPKLLASSATRKPGEAEYPADASLQSIVLFLQPIANLF